ncbi:MAG: type II and III secretion system protein family protein [Alphaproteobacteria bacterium]|nr:MAG: type II and III secretion system protein family protein [Alphaproteobacteria bacterium]
MRILQALRVAAAALGLAAAMAAPVAAEGVLKIMAGAPDNDIKVVVNRAVVMESDTPFAELSVANPKIADIASLSDRSIYILGKAPGRTSLTLLTQDAKLITNVEVHVVPDIAEFKERLKEILPDEPIEVRTANDGIVLSGRVSGARKISQALELAELYAPGKVRNLMTVGGTQQVMLKVRFAEMARSVAKDLTASVMANGNLGPAQAGGLTQSAATAGNVAAVIQQDPTQVALPRNRAGMLVFRLGTGSLGAALMLEALEQKGLVRTLAEPNIVAISGKQAEFLAGGEYPVPVSDGGSVTIDYKPFGIRLKFLPTVVDDTLISLSLEAEVSSIDSNTTVTNGGFTVNAFKTRRATTNVEMRDGQSFAIAGLLTDDFQDSVQQLPWLGDVPILGALFRSTSYQRQQSELVVIITAHLVTPTKGDALALPTDRVRVPTEAELFMFGKTSGRKFSRKTPAGDVARQNFIGSYGYIME